MQGLFISQTKMEIELCRCLYGSEYIPLILIDLLDSHILVAQVDVFRPLPCPLCNDHARDGASGMLIPGMAAPWDSGLAGNGELAPLGLLLCDMAMKTSHTDPWSCSR